MLASNTQRRTERKWMEVCIYYWLDSCDLGVFRLKYLRNSIIHVGLDRKERKWLLVPRCQMLDSNLFGLKCWAQVPRLGQKGKEVTVRGGRQRGMAAIHTHASYSYSCSSILRSCSSWWWWFRTLRSWYHRRKIIFKFCCCQRKIHSHKISLTCEQERMESKDESWPCTMCNAHWSDSHLVCWWSSLWSWSGRESGTWSLKKWALEQQFGVVLNFAMICICAVLWSAICAALWLWHMLGYGWCDSHLLRCHANHHPAAAMMHFTYPPNG